jgi:hypothetical protein
MRLTILSGGQTGVDRGALDAARVRGVRCGGWCPDGRLAEDGIIPGIYPLTPLPGGDYQARTLRNVLDSDGTVIIHFGPPGGGTAYTLECCVAHGKPRLLLDAGRLRPDAAGQRIATFVGSLARGLLNVAGPRASENPYAHAYAVRAVGHALDVLGVSDTPGVGRSGGPPLPRDSQYDGSAPADPSEILETGIMDTASCHSCAAPLSAPAFAGPAQDYCRFCTDASGKLKKKKEVRKAIARWMQSWQPGLGARKARKRARRYMRAMPAWAD